MIQLIQQIVLLLGTLTGGVTDAKTGYIYDWITLPMIGIGLVLSVMGQMWLNLILAAGITVFLYIMYHLGKIGGGDVKLFAGIVLLNPQNGPDFLISLGFFAAMSSMLFYSIFYTIKYVRKGVDFKTNEDSIKQAIMMGIVVAVYLGMLYYYGLAGPLFLAMFGVPLLAGLFFIAMQKGIKKSFFEKKVLLNKLEEDEVISFESNPKKVLNLFKTKGVVGEGEIALLKKMNITSIYVLRDLTPFGPFIFIGVCAAMLMPDFFMLLFL